MREFQKLKECHQKELDKFVEDMNVGFYHIDDTKKLAEEIWEDKCDKAIELIEADGVVNYITCADEDADDLDECDWFTIDNEAIAYINLIMRGC